jgi:hypothetical protein
MSIYFTDWQWKFFFQVQACKKPLEIEYFSWFWKFQNVFFCSVQFLYITMSRLFSCSPVTGNRCYYTLSFKYFILQSLCPTSSAYVHRLPINSEKMWFKVITKKPLNVGLLINQSWSTQDRNSDTAEPEKSWNLQDQMFIGSEFSRTECSLNKLLWKCCTYRTRTTTKNNW